MAPESAPAFPAFDLFISYSTDPDYRLVRRLEGFLETFDRLKTPTALPLRKLGICVDGSDFSLARLRRRATDDQDALDTMIRDYLGRSRRLLVVCSRKARCSPWVDREVRWFLANRPPTDILLAVSEGNDPATRPDEVIPQAALDAGLHLRPWYDLREARGREARGWLKVRGFDDETVRLAADLNEVPAGEVQPVWYREQRRTRRRRLTAVTTAALALLLAGGIAVYWNTVARREQALKLVASTYEQLYRDPSAAFLDAFRAHEMLPGPEARTALQAAYKVAVLHHYNRREISRISGTGPSYLAGRWKQGGVFSTTSPDGRHRLMVTERGEDGANPPGEVYLLDNESLRLRRLQPPDRGYGRVEAVGFDLASRRVFVVRYFQLTLYDLTGIRTGAFDFSRYTKSPVHLVDGYFAGRYVLAAETKGGLWLVDPESGPSATIELQRESHGDAALFVRFDAAARRAVLVFESGRGAILHRDTDGKPRLQELAKDGLLFADFDPVHSDRLLTGGRDGTVREWHWTSPETVPNETARLVTVTDGIDWISVSKDGRRLLTVGADRVLRVIERSRGRVVSEMRLDEGVDWTASRTVPVSPERVLPESVGPHPETLPFPDPRVTVLRTFEAGGQTWMVTERPSGNGVTRSTTYLVRKDRAVTFAGLDLDTRAVEVKAGLWWLKGSPTFDQVQGPLVRPQGDGLQFFPNSKTWPNAVIEQGPRVYAGTSRGLYAIEDGIMTRLGPTNLNVADLAWLGTNLWVASRQGAYRLRRDNDTLVGLTEPFLDVRSIRQVGGRLWLLTAPTGLLQRGGPAYLVDGLFSKPTPDEHARIVDVVEFEGRTWLFGHPGLYLMEGSRAVPISGIGDGVVRLERSENRLLARTRTTGIPESDGPTYVIDPDRRDARRAP